MKNLYLMVMSVKNNILLLITFVPLNIWAQVNKTDFINPPQNAFPSTYWTWMNGNISLDGITKDLEYMHNANYGAAMIFDVGVGIPRGTVDYYSKQWLKALAHAVNEAKKQNISLSMHNAPGYSATGGPWIPVEKSMKELVWTDLFIKSDGKSEVKKKLLQPISKMGFYRDAYVLAYPSRQCEKSFYNDVISVTVDNKKIDKSLLSDNNLSTEYRIEKGQQMVYELKEPFSISNIILYRGKREKPLDPYDGPRDYAPNITVELSLDGIDYHFCGQMSSPVLRSMDIPSTMNIKPENAKYIRITSNRGTNIAEINIYASSDIISTKEIIDLTSLVDNNGMLSWKAPAGRWTVVRIGYTTTGQTVAAAPDSGVGLECDKFSKDALDVHFDKFVTPMMNYLNLHCGAHPLESLVIDSWEAGKQNWTESFPEYFKSRRSYDIMPYMLTVTGRIVGSKYDTERFQYDLCRTQTDMFMENYVSYFKKRCAKLGLKYSGEAYGDGNFESLEMSAQQDFPMCEFWTHYIYGSITTTMMAASTAHVWDKKIVACESYTGTPFNSKFTEHPYGMKALGDYIMTAGVNRFVYHVTTHQPYTGQQKGNIMTMGPFGTHLDRNSTWANQFRALNLYNARCSYMLQQGKYVADVLYLKNENISSGVNNYNISYPATPYGYRWDVICAESLSRLSVKAGCLVLPDGMKYKLLVVTPMQFVSPETLKQLLRLHDAGAKLLLAGNKPSGYIGLNKRKNNEVLSLVDKLWNARYNNIFHGGMVCDILYKDSVKPDFSFSAIHNDAQIHFIHKHSEDEDVYFVSNHRRREEKLTATFRVSGMVPTLWDAETGATDIPVSYEESNGLTRINISLSECGSLFIVFRKGNTHSERVNIISPVRTAVHGCYGCYPFDINKDLRSTFTISLWANPETYAADNKGFLMFSDAGNKNMAKVGLAMGQNGVRVYERSDKSMVVIDSKKPVEGWTHVVLVYNKGVPVLYLNGIKEAQGDKSIYNCIPALDVPQSEEQYVCSFEGDQTDFEVFDYAMTEFEVKNIFREGLPAPAFKGENVKDISENWDVLFPEWSKAPAKITMRKLQPLNENENFDIRHFSGTATYIKNFTMDKDVNTVNGKKFFLNLGRVENIAEISINGSEPILVWKAPFSADITDFVRSGENQIKVSVTNLYPNRMIGDECLPTENEYDQYGRLNKLPEWYKSNETNSRKRVLFSTWKHYKADDPLLEAGLLGPVCISTVE